MDFNQQQKQAIETIDKNLCVVAGAGTGKTAILTHRFINILKSSKLPPKKTLTSILAITFTKKATEEMVKRISKEIRDLSDQDSRFQGLLNYIPFIKVSTIDSFCKNIIDENNLYIGLGSDYEIIEEYEGDKILNDIIKEIVIAEMNENTLLSRFMIESNCSRINNLVFSLNKAYRKIISKGYEFNKLLEKFPDKENKLDTFKLSKELELKIEMLLDEKLANGRHKIIKLYKNGILEDLKYSENNSKEILIEILSAIGNLKDQDHSLIMDITSLINESLIILEQEYKEYYNLINNLLIKIDENFREEKRISGQLEFNDLLYYTKIILKNDKIRKSYQEDIKYIMIDEFQDTNYIQRDIFYSLASESNLLDRNNFFVVGDPKQAIYGFRGSELSVFEETMEDIKKSNGEIIRLVDNYRSSEELVNYANILFNQVMGNKYDNLISNKEYKNKKVNYLEIISEDEKESDIVAQTIKSLVNEGKKYEDIAVLFRSSTNLKELEDSLSKYNIPYINPKSKEFFNKREILDLILFVKVLNSPEDNLNLYGLLRSNIFLIDDEKLYDLSKNGDSLWNNLLNYDGNDFDILRSQRILMKILAKKNQASIYQLVKEFINETRYYEFYSFISNSQQEIENIRKFEELALEYSANYNNYTNEFLEYILNKSEQDENEASVELSNNCVRLMTIHSAKGLEFPVVIFYDSKNSHRYRSEDIEINGELGYGLKLDGDSLIYNEVKNRNNILEKEERDRLLYVCVTRAEKEFIFINLKNNEKEKIHRDSFLEQLVNIEDYEYNIIKVINSLKPIKKTRLTIKTDESLISEEKKEINQKKDIVSSITGYNVYKSCPREYYYKYKLGIKNTEILDKGYDNFSENKDPVTISREDAAEFGTMVHSLIENLDEDNVDKQILESIENSSIDEKDNFKIRIKKNLDTYLENKILGKSIYEFGFLYKLDEGMMTGSIDELVFTDDGVCLIDFKTNKVKNDNHLEELVDYYKPQIRLYSLVTEKLIGEKPKKSYIYFLDYDKIVEVPWDDEENENLLKELNNFLRFVSYNDSIDWYEVTGNCYHCDFKTICNKE